MKKHKYTEEFKKLAVQKYLSRGNRSLVDLASEIGAAKSTIWLWVEKYNKSGNNAGMNYISKRPQDWSAEEKIQACLEYEKLSEEERGVFLRSKGLHSSKILEWRQQCIAALENKNHAHERNKLSDANRKLKELEQDLRRKEKALAEAAALLMLKKKADLIWGIEENS